MGRPQYVNVHDMQIISSIFQIFSREQERVLMDYILKCSQLYYGLSITELKKLAFQFARKIQAKYPATWDVNQMAGKDFHEA